MSRALQIKQAGEILGAEFKITDIDIQLTLEDIINNLVVKGKEPIFKDNKYNFVISYSEKIFVDEKIGDAYLIYMQYDKIKNSLMYTTHFTSRVKREGFKMKSNKFHTLLGIIMNKNLKVRIGRIHPFRSDQPFPVC